MSDRGHVTSTMFDRDRALISSANNRRVVSTARFLLLRLSNLGKEFIGEDRKVRLFETDRLEHVEDAVRHHRTR